jgi:hypothetical protein
VHRNRGSSDSITTVGQGWIPGRGKRWDTPTTLAHTTRTHHDTHPPQHSQQVTRNRHTHRQQDTRNNQGTDAYHSTTHATTRGTIRGHQATEYAHTSMKRRNQTTKIRRAEPHKALVHNTHTQHTHPLRPAHTPLARVHTTTPLNSWTHAQPHSTLHNCSHNHTTWCTRNRTAQNTYAQPHYALAHSHTMQSTHAQPHTHIRQTCVSSSYSTVCFI